MKISVVIPAHNEELTIANTIRAVLAQDYPDFEVIVVNNASSDRTAEIVSGFPVRLVNESRKGLLWAREKGRKEASGQIIANIDADCVPEKDWLTRGAKHFIRDENDHFVEIVAVTGPYDYHDAKPFFRNTSLFIQKYIYRPFQFILQSPLIKNGAILIGGNNFIRADILEKADGYNTDLTFYGEDTDTAKRVSRYGRVVFSPTLIMKTSARRFKNEGVISIESKYIYHFFKNVFK
ncbi:MAG: glycosyltransferase family 2 protein [Candidatus Taylorbacteria bacterium]